MRNCRLGNVADESLQILDRAVQTVKPKQKRRTSAKLPVSRWFVYIVCCGDGSLYTGITMDMSRRCKQHNAGTASRYTRSRRPVKLVYQENLANQSSALKREAAIKAMTPQGKLAMIRLRKKSMNG
jgi:predicted GIY-YIG superfamily endonuclease